MEISERQKNILMLLTKEYIETAQALSSDFLVKKYNLGISSATARNDLSELEEKGYIFQAHTSAARIPTEKAYNLYLDNILSFKKRKASFKKLEALSFKSEDDFKKVAKLLAEISENAVFWAFHKNSLYYTGISNLFLQPEFKKSNLFCDVSVVIDSMEEIITDIFDELKDGENVYIGSNNPFGDFLSVVMLKYGPGLVGILGPMRMDYEKNLNLISFLKSKL